MNCSRAAGSPAEEGKARGGVGLGGGQMFFRLLSFKSHPGRVSTWIEMC